MKKKFLKLFVFVMIFGMIFPLPISAEESNLSNAQDEPVLYVPEYLPGDLTHEQLKTAVLPINERSDFISAAQVEEKHHVNRIYEQEPDEYTIMFQNGDGGKTAYIFSIPVKTANADGTFTDKSASQIISEQSQIMTLSIPGKLEATAPETSTSLKFLSEKLTAYIEANDIKSYQMLAPEYKTNTLTSSGLIEDNLIINPGTTPSTQVMSVAVTSSDMGGTWSLMPYESTAYFTYTNNVFSMQETNDPIGSRFFFSYVNSYQYEIVPIGKQNIYLSHYDGILTTAGDSDDFPIVWNVQYYDSISYLITNGVYMLKNTNATLTYDYDYVHDLMHIGDLNHAWRFVNHDSGNLLENFSIDASGTQYSYQGNIFIHINNGSFNTETLYLNHDPDALYFGHSTLSWYSSNESVISVDEDNGSILNLNDTGTAQIYCKYIYNTTKVSNSITVNVYSLDSIELTTTGITYTIGSSFMPVCNTIGYTLNYPTEISLHSTNPNVVSVTSDGRFKIESSGVAEIYVKHVNSGIESNRILISPESPSFVDNATYLIRPYSTSIDETTPLLTVNTPSGLANSPSLSTWASSWNTCSQAFTIKKDSNNYYGITAILSTSQYNVPFNYDCRQEFNYTGIYGPADKTTKQNTLTGSSTVNTLPGTAVYNSVYASNAFSDSAKWIIEKENDKYYIYQIIDDETYYLSHSGGSSLTISDQKTNSDWAITSFGLDVPVIKQTTHYYCGATSLIKILYYFGIENSNNYVKAIKDLHDVAAASASVMTTDEISSYLNSEVNRVLMINNSYIAKLYNKFTETTFETTISSNLNQGFPMVILVSSTTIRSLSYYGSSYNLDSGHFVNIVGYDTATKKFLMSDCHYDNDYFGLHIENFSNVYAAFYRLVHHVS